MSINIKAPLALQKQNEEAEAPEFEVEVSEVADTSVEKPADKQAPETEAEDYSERVQKRIKHLSWKAHENERAAQTAFKERDEAVGVLKRLFDENQALKKGQSATANAYVGEAEARAKAEIDAGKRALKEAFEASDFDKVGEAQEQISRATTTLMIAQQQKNALSQQQEQEKAQAEYQRAQQQQRPQQQQRVELPPVDKRSAQWLSENSWFVGDDHMSLAMRAYAMNVHDKLAAEGVEVGSDEYYKNIDTEMKNRWSDQLGERPQREKPVERQRPATVVAGAQRTAATAPRKVKLSETQVTLARRLGITPEQYAAELLKQEKSNG